jgi:hypothetical protein
MQRMCDGEREARKVIEDEERGARMFYICEQGPQGRGYGWAERREDVV